MSKVLVVKGADFSINAVEQIVIEENIPCTGLELSISGQSVESVGDTLTITAVKTPADTTDTIIYSSSEERVAKVDSNGIVTVVGIGTATITATCGGVTATVTVNQASLLYDGLATVDDYRANNIGDSNTKMVLRIHASADSVAIGKANDNTYGLQLYGTTDIEAIPVPYGATTVTIDPNSTSAWGYLFIGDMINPVPNFNGKGRDIARYVSNNSSFRENVPQAVEYGQCIILSASPSKVSAVSGLLFQ